MTLLSNPISKILDSVYGVGPMVASPITVIWATNRLAYDSGYPKAVKALRQINRSREKHGRMVACPDFHADPDLFNAWSASFKKS